jgi:hypothetical protein
MNPRSNLFSPNGSDVSWICGAIINADNYFVGGSGSGRQGTAFRCRSVAGDNAQGHARFRQAPSRGAGLTGARGGTGPREANQ